jgi:membrane protein implicated in regulation of membrane protease activity
MSTILQVLVAVLALVGVVFPLSAAFATIVALFSVYVGWKESKRRDAEIEGIGKRANAAQFMGWMNM